MKKIVAKLSIEIYDDGSYNVERMPFSSDESDLKNSGIIVSERISQILDVLNNVMENKPVNIKREQIGYIISESIQLVARRNSVTPSTVADKLTRQLGWNKEQLVDSVMAWLTCDSNWIKNEENDLKTKILSKCSTKNHINDQKAVEAFFKSNS